MNNSTDKIWVLISNYSHGMVRDTIAHVDKMEAVRMKLNGVNFFDLSELIEDDLELEYLIADEC